MVKTYCKDCVFNNVQENQDCWFGIPALLEGKKNLSKRDGYFLIDDYRCMYGSNLSKTTDASIEFEDILKLSIEQNLLRYYLFLDLTKVIDTKQYIENLVSLVNKMDNVPRFISLLMYYDEKNAQLAKYIEANISSNIKWKIHNITLNTTIEHGMYVNVSTNIGANYSSSILFCIASDNPVNDMDKIETQISFVHTSQIILQESAHLFMKDINVLDGILIPNFIYKEIIGYGDKKIVNTIQKIYQEDKHLKIMFYDKKNK